jgi:hypothetical protein
MVASEYPYLMTKLKICGSEAEGKLAKNRSRTSIKLK